MIELLLLGTQWTLPGKSEADMATSKTAQLTHQDILGRDICNGFDEAMDSMDNDSTRPHAHGDARLSTPSSSGALTACGRGICSVPTRPTATKFSLWRPDGIRCRSISRIFLCSGNLHRDAIGLGNAVRDWPAAVTALKQKAFLSRMTSIRARRMRRNLLATN